MQAFDQCARRNSLDATCVWLNTAGLAQHSHSSKLTDRPAPLDSGIFHVLSRREMEVLELVARGASNVQIADALAVSVHTVKKHVAHLILRLKVSSRSEAATLYRDAVSGSPGRGPGQPERLDGLTLRERDVLARIATGANNQNIAADLALSLNTVKRHTTRILSKLGVRSRVTAAALLHASATT
jgi:DNA-binding NarL/FixJ family response regulator